MDLPDDNGFYKKQSYWDHRYEKETSFDWFAEYGAFRDHIVDTLHVEDRILMLGCGNSKLSEDMYTDGYHHIHNIDYSPVVIEGMEQRYQHLPEMRWQVMDVTCMEFSDGQFDAVVEKGTLDALLVDEKDPWSLSEEGEQMIESLLTQVSRFLKPGGRFISVTFAQPHFRKPLYAKTKFDWSLQTRTFGDTFHYFVYIMTKGLVLSEKEKEVEEKYKCRKQTPQEKVLFCSDSDGEDFLTKIGDA